MNDININATLDFTLKRDDILIYIMFNDKNNIVSKTLQFKVLKRYDKESPILKNITDTSIDTGYRKKRNNLLVCLI